MDVKDAIEIAEATHRANEHKGNLRCQCIDCSVNGLLLKEIYRLRAELEERNKSSAGL